MVGDISNAYFESYTKEKICFTTGSEFGDLARHSFVIVKVLYGLRTSGARFHEVLAKTLSKEGFVALTADPDLWLRQGKNCYEYI